MKIARDGISEMFYKKNSDNPRWWLELLMSEHPNIYMILYKLVHSCFKEEFIAKTCPYTVVPESNHELLTP